MIRIIALIALILWPVLSSAQRSDVSPNDATLTITIENVQDEFLENEMILLTIHGVYRRHITREKLVQPTLNGFGWMQLGEDYWYDSTENGLKVKNMRRRMALYPNRTGQVEIGAFRHVLTFLDEELKWFEHEIASEPIVIDVGTSVGDADWWLPVHRLELEDSWSNPPDQLQEGSGVLRVIRVEAHGASPDMLPPMPELKSPSANIYPHPEKRMVELTPRGPVAIAFWRWTLRPTKNASAILEPLIVDYFDTVTRESKRAEISAQRIAYGTVTGRLGKPDKTEAGESTVDDEEGLAIASRFGLVAVFSAVLVVSTAALVWSMTFIGTNAVLRRFRLDEPSRRMRKAVSEDDPILFRRWAHRLANDHGVDPRHLRSLSDLDNQIFANSGKRSTLSELSRRFGAELRALLKQETPDQSVRP